MVLTHWSLMIFCLNPECLNSTSIWSGRLKECSILLSLSIIQNHHLSGVTFLPWTSEIFLTFLTFEFECKNQHIHSMPSDGWRKVIKNAHRALQMKIENV